MKLVLYQDDKAIAIYPGVINPTKTESGVKWDTGELSGVSVPFILVNEEVEIEAGDAIPEEIRIRESIPFEQDITIMLRQENESLKQQLADTNSDLMGLMDYVFGQ